MINIETAAASIDTSEWFDVDATTASRMALGEPNEDEFFVATTLFSFWPIVNENGATLFPEDMTDDILTTLIGRQANLTHDKAKVVGSILAFLKTDTGVDVGVRIDRDQAAIHGLNVEDMREHGFFSRVSLEMTKDLTECAFLVYDEGRNIVKTIPSIFGRQAGIKRTRNNNGYRYQGYEVAERLKPARFTGVGFVPNPADHTATLYKVAASDSFEEIPLTPVAEQISAETSGSDVKPTERETSMSEVEIQALRDEITSLKYSIQYRDSDAEQIAASRAVLQLELDTLKAKLAESEDETASVKAERDALVTANVSAAKEVAANELASTLEAILPSKDDAEKALLREKAFEAVGDDGIIRLITLERTNEALSKQIADINAAKAAADATAALATGEIEVNVSTETASTEVETFSANTPDVSIAPSVSTEDKTTGKGNIVLW